jgi:hypothetical protein
MCTARRRWRVSQGTASLLPHFGREFLPARDKQVMDRQLESGEGELFLPDVNRR